MRCSILGFFLLILGILSKLTLNIVDKNLEIFDVFPKENFELRSNDESDALMVVLMLSLSKANSGTKK